MKTYLGVDLGTSSLKVVVAQGGKIIDSEHRSYPCAYPREGWSEQNPDDWLDAFHGVLAALARRVDLSLAEGISFCGQMHGLVLLDEHDRVIRPAILWNDNRTTEECSYLNDVIGTDRLVSWTGNIAFTGFTAPKILWVKRHEPENFRRIRKIMLPKDYLVYQISGVFASDVSDSSGTLYFDVANRRWSEPMLAILGIAKEQLPTVFDSFQAIGTVRPAFAARTGLGPATKVVVGGGDQAVGAIGTGTVGEGRMCISLGTSGVVFASSSKYLHVASGSMHSFCHANGGYHVMGVMLAAGGSLNWWANDILRTDDYPSLMAECAGSGADGLWFLPYINGERSPINDPHARGCFQGLNVRHGRGDLTRAVIEGICFGLCDCFESMHAIGISCDAARVIGGGAKSDFWMQMLSDVLGIRLSRIETAEGGAIGAVILAMTGCGAYPTVDAACADLIKDVGHFTPDAAAHAAYASKFQKYKALYQAIKQA